MTEKVKRLYKSAVKNKAFLIEIYEADGDKKPKPLARSEEKLAFAAIYYGWLLGKYGMEWELHL